MEYAYSKTPLLWKLILMTLPFLQNHFIFLVFHLVYKLRKVLKPLFHSKRFCSLCDGLTKKQHKYLELDGISLSNY